MIPVEHGECDVCGNRGNVVEVADTANPGNVVQVCGDAEECRERQTENDREHRAEAAAEQFPCICCGECSPEPCFETGQGRECSERCTCESGDESMDGAA